MKIGSLTSRLAPTEAWMELLLPVTNIHSFTGLIATVSRGLQTFVRPMESCRGASIGRLVGVFME